MKYYVKVVPLDKCGEGLLDKDICDPLCKKQPYSPLE